MPRKRSIVAAAPMAEILKQAGAERVADDAARAMADLIYEKAVEIAKDAVRFAKHTGRKTIKRSDIELVRRSV